jgi:Recombination directionality factor-like
MKRGGVNPMGILGLTHDENGTALQKLPVTIKVAIGEGPEPSNANSYPRKLDHFIFKRKTLRGQDVVWEPAPDIAQAHGDKPTTLGIIFLNDDPREVFRTEYALWTPSGCRCHGELVQIANGEGMRFEMRAIRRTQKHPEGEPWPGNYKYADGPKKGQPVEPCGDGCPDLERGDCKPSGDLYFILEKFPTFGAICRLHTSSYRSIRNLSNGLMQIRRLNGGHLTGIKATLKASPERISYTSHDGTRHTSVAYILSLEIGGTDLRTLVANMTEPIRLLGEGHSAASISPATQIVVTETDRDRAGEIAGEFYPSLEPASDEPDHSLDPSRNSEVLNRICDLCRQLGYNDAKTHMLIGQFARDLDGLERKLRNQWEAKSQTARPSNGAESRGGDNGHALQHNSESASAGPGNSAAHVNGFLY